MGEKKVHMPEVTDFNEFFTDAKPFDKDENEPRFLVLDNGKHAEVVNEPAGEFMRVGNYLSIRDGGSLHVKPTEMLFEFIMANFLFIAYDTIHFEIVNHGEGKGLLIVSHGQIIADRWMTQELEMATIPMFPETATFDVRTGEGTVKDDGTFTDTVETAIERVPRQNSGWQSVRYKGHRYQLHGGIRTNWFVCLNSPTGKG